MYGHLSGIIDTENSTTSGSNEEAHKTQQANFPACTPHYSNHFKGVLNPNFLPFSFELKKNRFFEINFDLGFRVL